MTDSDNAAVNAILNSGIYADQYGVDEAQLVAAIMDIFGVTAVVLPKSRQSIPLHFSIDAFRR